MTILKEFLKGILIGIANIIPGVSGGTMAVSMGVYDKMISAITGLRKHFKQSVMILIPYIFGAIVGIGALSFIVKYTLLTYPLQTSGLFIGLIIGGLPIILTKVAGKKVNAAHIILFLLFFSIVVGMALLNGNSGTKVDISVNISNMILLFFIGIIASATMIIPGVSGSLVLMILGFYNIIISNISSFIKALISMDLPALLHGVGIFLPFGIGIIIGIALIAKIIEILFAKAPVLTYYAIIGLIFGSPLAIIIKTGAATVTIVSIGVTIITFCIGFAISFFLGSEEK